LENQLDYDAVIVGAGHNGLVAACYLAQAGLSVLILEKNERIGGATYSKRVFPGVDARVSVYSYLVSLLPQKICSDLGLKFETRRRAVASYTPVERDGLHRGLLISNVSEAVTRESFRAFTGSERDHRRFQALQEKLEIFARIVWPTLLAPLPSKRALRDQFQSRAERDVWDYLVEKPLAALIEDHLDDDALRGLVFTDAKIGVHTYPDDPSLLQNRTFLYHIIGQGTGEWRVPVGGMGALVEALRNRAQALGVRIETSAEVVRVDHGLPVSGVAYNRHEKQTTVNGRFVLFNSPSDVVNRCLSGAYSEDRVQGSVFKINMLLKKLPAVKAVGVDPADAFSGTFHLNEGYEHMKASYQNAQSRVVMEGLPGEMYCHSLTDPSILSKDLQEQGHHTLTLFGLDVPYDWFIRNNEQKRDEITQNFLRSIQYFIREDLTECLAVDAKGKLCIEAMSPLDLESGLGLPKGNIFHGNLTWPFAEDDKEAGAWGVETHYDNVLICGSSAKRGGAVSGIPGHNAAMKVLEHYSK
jgi:phytoene dehydrogenase-like protein